MTYFCENPRCHLTPLTSGLSGLSRAQWVRRNRKPRALKSSLAKLPLKIGTISTKCHHEWYYLECRWVNIIKHILISTVEHLTPYQYIDACNTWFARPRHISIPVICLHTNSQMFRPTSEGLWSELKTLTANFCVFCYEYQHHSFMKILFFLYCRN